jgi:hypothetical protein
MSTGPSGIGGWLILLAIGQLLAPLRMALDIATSTTEYLKLPQTPEWRSIVVGETALNLALLALVVVTSWFFFAKSARFPGLFLIQWFAIPTILFLDCLLVSVVLGTSFLDALMDDSSIPVLGSFMSAGIWMCYIARSKRVQNTFVR